jgi:flagellar hook-basal body complex protein FliE
MDPITASRAYQSLNTMGKVVSGGDETTTTDSAGGSSSSGGPTFADYLKSKARESVDTLRESEEVSAKAVTGEADMTDVVQAVTSAELTLQTVVSVRDRMISAYQEIMRMPI